jgi:hypothetical protein
MFQDTGLSLEALRVGDVIGIHAPKVRAVRERKNLVQTGWQASMHAVYQDCYTFIAESASDLDCAICRSVVYHDQVPVAKGLQLQGANSLG